LSVPQNVIIDMYNVMIVEGEYTLYIVTLLSGRIIIALLFWKVALLNAYT
jgi:hypothetical protein